MSNFAWPPLLKKQTKQELAMRMPLLTLRLKHNLGIWLQQHFNLPCETLQVDSGQEETTNLDQEADTCKQIPPGYLYQRKQI